MKNGRSGAICFASAIMRNRTVDQVLRQVVVAVSEARRPVLRRVSGLVDHLLVLHEVGVPLVGLSAEVPVEALEAAAGRPVALRRCHVRLVLGDDVPLADRVRVVALLGEHFGDRRRLERDVPVRAGKAGRRFGDAGHPDRRVVASREQRRRTSTSRSPSCGTACTAVLRRTIAASSASRSDRRTAPVHRCQCRPTR